MSTVRVPRSLPLKACSAPGATPDMDQTRIEALLKAYLGVTKVLWVPRGVYRDETTGHVDNLLHYCAPGLVVLLWTEDRDDPQYERSEEALAYLSSVTDARVRRWKSSRCPCPVRCL